MVEDDYPEGTFFHYLSGDELCVQYGDGKLFLTYYSGVGKPRAKRVLSVADAAPEDIVALLRDYRRAEDDE